MYISTNVHTIEYKRRSIILCYYIVYISLSSTLTFVPRFEASHREEGNRTIECPIVMDDRVSEP